MRLLTKATNKENRRYLLRLRVSEEAIETQREVLMNLAAELAQRQFKKVFFGEDKLDIYYEGQLFSYALFIRIPSGQETFMLQTCVDGEVIRDEQLTQRSVQHIIYNLEAAERGRAI